MSKQFLIVGSKGSIGKATSNFFDDHNIDWVGTSRYENDDSRVLSLDLTNYRSIKSVAANFRNDSLKGIVFTSGLEPQMSLQEMTLEHMTQMFGIHLLGPIQLSKLLVEKLTDNSNIVFISSVAAYKGSYDPLYATVKGGINSLVKTLARELSPVTRVNAIAPSLIKDSPVFERMTPDFREKHLQSTLSKRLLEAEECADAIGFLISNKHMNGQIIHINGGQYFGN